MALALICMLSLPAAAAATADTALAHEHHGQTQPASAIDVSLGWSMADQIPPSDDAAQPALNDPFAKGAWNVIVYGSAAIGNEGDVYTGHAGVGYAVLDDLIISLELLGGTINTKPTRYNDDILIGGLDLILRYRLWHGDRWAVFVEGGAGVAGMEEDFPRGGTDYVFRPQFGGGAMVRVCPRAWLIAGLRWLHMSNANTSGSDQNPGYDSIQAFAGFTATF